MSKEKTFFEKYEAIQKVGHAVEVPWEVKHVFPMEGSSGLRLEVLGEQVSLGEDYVSMEEAREAVAWLVTQLGGKVSWKSQT